jgi:hypothetical protein
MSNTRNNANKAPGIRGPSCCRQICYSDMDRGCEYILLCKHMYKSEWKEFLRAIVGERIQGHH